MNMVPIFCLVAVFCGPLHAQVCSRGAGGGMDATGNQCIEAAGIEAYANDSKIASPRPAAKMRAIRHSLAVPGATRVPAKMSGAPAAAIVKTVKVETVAVSPCSGGADGGMDATGNQCADSPVVATHKGMAPAKR